MPAPNSCEPLRVVVMGVAGCGKSAVGQGLAQLLGLPLVEGDEFHPAANVEKMRQGRPLEDQDRTGWLDRLGEELERQQGGAVLTCSALKRSYRERLRRSAPALKFVHLTLSPEQALQRVARRDGHFYPPSLVASQFAALEDPHGEPGVLALDASQPLPDVTSRAAAWLSAPAATALGVHGH